MIRKLALALSYWKPLHNIETAGTWYRVTIWGQVIASVSINNTVEIYGEVVGMCGNQAEAAQWTMYMLKHRYK